MPKPTNPSQELAVVVGATGAFGQVIVERLIARGLTVLAVARRADSLQTLRARWPQHLLPCAADLSTDAGGEALREQLDVLARPVRLAVHGPGVAVVGGILEAPTAAVVDAVNIKVGGMIRLTRAVDAHLRPQSRLVAIAGHYGLEPSAYAASAGVANAALFNLMRQLSLSLGPRGITAHTLAPGPADTERLRRVVQDRARQQGRTPDQVLDGMRAESSLGQMVDPQQVAWAVCLLLDPEADAMTGSTLMLDAGRRHGLP